MTVAPQRRNSAATVDLPEAMLPVSATRINGDDGQGSGERGAGSRIETTAPRSLLPAHDHSSAVWSSSFRGTR
jgi:hypothetical protein